MRRESYPSAPGRRSVPYPARAPRVSRRKSATASAAACGPTGLASRTDQPAADDHAVGDLADLGRLLRRADPEADRDRDLGLRLGRGDQLGELRRAAPRARRSCRRWRRRRRSPGRRRRSGARRPAGVVGATSGTSASPAVGERLADLAPPPRAAGRGRSRRRRRPRPPASANAAAPPWREPCSRRPSARPAPAPRPRRRSPAPIRRWPGRQRRRAAAWIVGPSASGSEKGTPSSIRSAPASA